MEGYLSAINGKYTVGLLGIVFSILSIVSCSNAVERVSEKQKKTPPEIPLAVTKTIPDDNARDVSPDLKIVISFSEALDESTFTNESVKLYSENDLTNDIPLNITYDNNTGFLQLNAQLSPDTMHFVLVTTLVKDIKGRSIANDFKWVFRTGEEIDKFPPQAKLVSPALDTPASLNTNIVVKFNEAVNLKTITLQLNGEIILANGAAQSPYTSIYTLDSLSIALPDLLANTEYTVELDGAVSDLIGNSMQNNTAWVFTTGDAPDVTAPILTAQTPNSGAENLLRDTRFQVTFSEPLNQSSVNSNSVYLISQAGDLVNLNIQYAASNNSLYIKPSRFLAFNEVYFLGLDGLTDISGNSLGKTHLIYTIELDRDNDGMPNRWEDPYGDLLADSDIEVDSLGNIVGDGLKNIDEFNYNSNPANADTDNDGINDGAEVAIGRNPTVNEPVLLTIVTSLILSN